MRLDIEQLKCFACDNGWEVHAEDSMQHLVTFRTKKVLAVLDVWDGKKGITVGLLLCGRDIVKRSKMYFRHCRAKDVTNLLRDVEYWRELKKLHPYD